MPSKRLIVVLTVAVLLVLLAVVLIVWFSEKMSSNSKSKAAGQEYCYNTDSDPYRGYSTKTPLDEARGQEVTQEDIPGCQAVHFYLLARHGTRFNGDDDIIDMGEQLPIVQEHLADGAPHDFCDEDMAAIQAWELRMVPEDDKELTETGWQEFRELAQRYKVRYPDLLDREYSEEAFEFLHTEGSSNRTRDTARAFAEGLFGTFENINIIENDPDTDWLLLYYKLCTKYIEEVDDQPIIEQEKFLAGEEVAGVTEDVTNRLGYPPGFLEFDDVDALYDACRVEYGAYWDAPWCACFTENDLKVIEYLEDLKYYWRDAYGHSINYEQSCPLIVDILDEWRSSLDENADYAKLAATRYTHSTTLNTFMTRLGLYKDDEDLYADDFGTNDDREYVTSRNVPMGSNVAFALYECDDGDNRVKMFVNDRPTTIPGCPEDEDACSYDHVVSLWQEWADNCDMAEICELEGRRP